ncbi:unnamed protein product [Dimorphilus gyrociliatus]|uniref:Uncharacterized protein n=1 Tax=Dimorphilus gyrociliatus TaxID=2664684 RepID=A0A7I8WFI3_9ANNE|nr:unnamed protein product [Dimorphilus gyrociliatus]
MTCSLLPDFVAECILLKEINFRFNTRFSEDFKKICNGLQLSSMSLLSIDFSFCCLNSQQICYLSNLLSNCTQLQNIQLANNAMSDEVFQILCNSLKSSSASLLTINFSHCSIDDSQAYHLYDLLKECRSLETFLLSGNNKLADGFEMICNGLKVSSQSLQNINFNGISVPIVENENVYLNCLVRECLSLREITLPKNVKSYLLIDHFKSSSPLINNEFSDNRSKCNFNRDNNLSAIDFKRICNRFKLSINNLVSINFSFCCRLKNLFSHFADFVKECTFLQKINISGIFNFGDNFKRICSSLKSSSKTLLSIDVSSCDLDSEQCNHFSDLLAECTQLKGINLSGNINCGDGFLIICNALKLSSKTLEYIDVLYCGLNEKQGNSLADLLKQCNSLRDFSLIYNLKISKAFEKMCQGLLSSSHSLLSINLQNYCLNGEQNENLTILLGECKSLQKVIIIGDRCFTTQFKDIFKGLQISRKHISQIQLGPLDIDNATHLDFIIETIPGFPSLKAIRLTFNVDNFDSIDVNLSRCLNNTHDSIIEELRNVIEEKLPCFTKVQIYEVNDF